MAAKISKRACIDSNPCGIVYPIGVMGYCVCIKYDEETRQLSGMPRVLTKHPRRGTAAIKEGS